MLKPIVSIVIPVYNEFESLPELARQIREVCDKNHLSFESWLIDDGSTDDSWKVIALLHRQDPRFKGIRFRRNYGKSAALAVGFKHVRGRYTITLDADLQDDPNEIPALIELLQSGYDLVSGWKQKRNDPLSKTIPSKFFNWVTQKTSGIALHDFNCGLKAYRTEVIKSVKLYGELHRYIPLLAKWEGYHQITEKVVNHRARIYGKSKFGFERYIRGFLDLVSVSFVTRFAARPMHFFGTVGTLAFLAGFGIALYLSIDWVLGHPLANRPLLFFAMLLMLLGAQSFMTGLLGEMFIKPNMERADAYDIKEILKQAELS